MAQFFARRAVKSSELNNKATKQKVAATLFLCFFVVNFERNQTDFCLFNETRGTSNGARASDRFTVRTKGMLEMPGLPAFRASKRANAALRQLRKLDSFLFAAAMTACVLVSMSKTEFKPCGSHGGSPRNSPAEFFVEPARPSPDHAQKFAACNARPALHDSATWLNIRR